MSGAGRVRLEAVVRGVVQGVGFRFFVVREASALGLDGWVANRADGTVELAAEGERRALEALAARLHEGPAGALVEHVAAAWAPARGEPAGFAIRSGAHRGD